MKTIVNEALRSIAKGKKPLKRFSKCHQYRQWEDGKRDPRSRLVHIRGCPSAINLTDCMNIIADWKLLDVLSSPHASLPSLRKLPPP